MANLKLPQGKNIVYKIRRKDDGLFSQGGSMPSFNKSGKIWKQKGHLTSHINQLWGGSGVSSYNYTHPHQRHVYENCEIVPYEIVETEMPGKQTILGYVEEREEKKRQEAIQAELRRQERAKEARRKQFEELKEEFE